MKKRKRLLILISMILIVSVASFHLVTKDHLPYETIGYFQYDVNDNSKLEEMVSTKDENSFQHETWYKKLKEKIENGESENKIITESENKFDQKKITAAESYYTDAERGNNGYMRFVEEGETTYLSLTPGFSTTTLADLKVKRIYEKDKQIIIDLETINSFDASIEYRVLFIRMKTSDIKGKDIIVRRNVTDISENDTIKDFFSSFKRVINTAY